MPDRIIGAAVRPLELTGLAMFRTSEVRLARRGGSICRLGDYDGLAVITQGHLQIC